MIGVAACPAHGAVYYQLDVDRDSVVAAELVKPLDTRLPRPVVGEAMTCPTCGAGLEKYLVADGTLP